MQEVQDVAVLLASYPVQSRLNGQQETAQRTLQGGLHARQGLWGFMPSRNVKFVVQVVWFWRIWGWVRKLHGRIDHI